MFCPEDLHEESGDRIRDWLAAHPEVQKAVIRFALRTDEFRAMESVQHQLNGLLYRSRLPEDIGAWHLDEAVLAEDADLTTKHLMEFTRSLARRPVEVDATLADARNRLRGRPDALHVLDCLLQQPSPRVASRKPKATAARPRRSSPIGHLADAGRSIRGRGAGEQLRLPGTSCTTSHRSTTSTARFVNRRAGVSTWSKCWEMTSALPTLPSGPSAGRLSGTTCLPLRNSFGSGGGIG